MNNNWQLIKLGEVCDFQNGFAFKSKLFKEKGLPILRISNIQQDKISYNHLVFFQKEDYDVDFEKYKVKKGDLIIAMSGATVTLQLKLEKRHHKLRRFKTHERSLSYDAKEIFS